MSYDGTPDTIFNPGGDPLPSASDLFKDLDEHSYTPPFGDPRFYQYTGGADVGVMAGARQKTRVNDAFPGLDVGTQGQTHRARVAHLPKPAHAIEEEEEEEEEPDLPPLFPSFTETDVAEELLTPETFEWWKTRDMLADQGLLPGIPKIYHCGPQKSLLRKSAAFPVFVAGKARIEWEELSLGVRWLILLRLSEKQSFGMVVVSQLKLHKQQVHEFVTTYVNFCDQWTAFEKSVMQRSTGLRAMCEMPDGVLVNWIHGKRPKLPTDLITDDDVQMGLRFLHERGITEHSVDFQEWIDERDTKDFVLLTIDGPIVRDCMDHRLLRRAAATKLLSIADIEHAIRQSAREIRRSEHNAHVRSVMHNEALLGTLQDLIPWDDDYLYNDVPISPEAQLVLDTISTDLRMGEPMPMPIPPYQRQQKGQESVRALRNMVPELQPHYISGSFVKTHWEADSGSPNKYSTDLTHHIAETQQVPEEQTRANTARGPAARGSGSSVAQAAARSAGNQGRRQSDRYEKSSSLYSGAAPFHSPAAFAAALASGYNASRPRIGAARARYMTSNDKGQLMVGMAVDLSKLADRAPQNPGYTRQPAEQGYRRQPEVPRRAVEAEPAHLPNLRPAEAFGPDESPTLQRSKRSRRLSARARESLQYALELEEDTETASDKPRAKKARTSRSKKQQEDGDVQAGSSKEEDGAPAAAGVISLPPEHRGVLTHPNASQVSILPLPKATANPTSFNTAKTVSPPIANEVPIAETEPGQSGSEASTTTSTQQRSSKKRVGANQKSEKFFGMYKTQELNACPPPVSTIHCAWSADEANFAVEAVQACYALTADRINPDALVPRNLQMNRDTIQATLASMEAEYTRIERRLRGENGPNAERAEFAGVADSATFAIHATEASFAFEEVEVVPELDTAMEVDDDAFEA